MLLKLNNREIPIRLADYEIGAWGYTETLCAPSFFKLKSWVDENHHASLSYLADHRLQMRESLKNYFPECESALVFLFPYVKTKIALDDFYHSSSKSPLRFSSFVLGFEGLDYHDVIENRLRAIAGILQDADPAIEYRLSVDKHPVLERDLAIRAHLGGIGRSSMLIHPDLGSYFMIGTLILSKTLPLDLPKQDEVFEPCASACSSCLASCPGNAILLNQKQIDVSRCLSFKIFESKVESDLHFDGFELAGCERCLDACPWNEKAKQEARMTAIFAEWNEAQLKILNFFLARPLMDLKNELLSMSNKSFARYFEGTSFERIGRSRILARVESCLLLEHRPKER